MTIQDMHNTFRTLGQQMGMQLIRAILPESIDVYLNDAIIEWTREAIINATKNNLELSGVGKASTMSIINAFKTLYKKTKLDINITDSESDFYEVIIDETQMNPMMFLSFSVIYEDGGREINCRIINADDVDALTNDFCSKPTKDYPIAVLINDTDSNSILDVYTNKNPFQSINIKYIKYPNVVKYSDVDSECVNCDLPEYIHYAIVEKAVQKYFSSIGARLPGQTQ